MLINRRALLTGLGSLIVGAPDIVRVSNLMPLKVLEWTVARDVRQQDIVQWRASFRWLGPSAQPIRRWIRF